MSHKKTGRTKRNKKCVVPVDNEETFSDVLNYPFVPKETPSNSGIKIRMPFELGAPHKEFLHLLQTNKTKAVFLDGPAGTGKTYLSVLAGLEMLNGGFIESIYYVRSIVESASRQMGALPGEVEDKFLPWTMPLIDKVSELTSKAVGEDLFATGVLKGMPINYCRGLTFNRALVIVDECFSKDVFVETDKGRVKLGKILAEPAHFRVLSFNENSKSFEYKTVLRTFSRGEKALSTIKLDARASITATKSHKFLTTSGWKKLQDLKIGDGIISASTSKHAKTALNSSQRDIIIGGILGDLGLQRVTHNSFRAKACHGIAQEEYAIFKAGIMGCNTKFLAKNGFAQTPAVTFATKTFYLPIDVADRKKYAIQNTNIRSLAISWQDDGYYDAKNKHGMIYSCADNAEHNVLFAQKLNAMGFSCVASKYCNGQGREYFGVRFRNDGFSKFAEAIAPFIHPSMAYKLPAACRHKINLDNWETNTEAYSIRVVTGVTIDHRTEEVFDIEVEDNHNFVVSHCRLGQGTKVVAHNCQNLTKEEITTILTRFGHKSKYAILGDASQADIRHSGFRTILDAFNTPESVAQSIHCLKFTKNEIVRSEILKYIVAVLEKIPRHDHN